MPNEDVDLLPRVDALERRVDAVMAGYPKEDWRRHCDWHSAVDEREDDRRALFRTIRNWAIIAVMGVLASSLWSYFSAGLVADLQRQIAATQSQPRTPTP